MSEVENKENCNYFFISKPNINICAGITQRKINTCLNLPSLTSLGNIAQPEEEQNQLKLLKSKGHEAMKFVSFEDDKCSLENSQKKSG